MTPRSSTTPRSKLSVATLSDLHLGHIRNLTIEMLQNLDREMDDAFFVDLDILFFAGDVYDHLLSLTSVEGIDIDFWIARVLGRAKRHNVAVRIVEGTPSHDWKQSKRFEFINRVADIQADLKYVPDLSIEYMEKHDLYILYVPDEWETSTEKTYAQVMNLLQERNLTHVDFAIMHGVFDFQLPEFVTGPRHDSAKYLAIVKELIFIGHHHVFARHERIIAQGSFDRISHGEEGPKGYVRADVYRGESHAIQFIENKGAKIFKTITCLAMEIPEILAHVEREMAGIPDGSFIRLEADATNPIFTNMEVLMRAYPLMTWSKLARTADEDPVEHNLIDADEDNFVPITITKENIVSLLLERLTRKVATEAVLTQGERLLRELV